MPRRELRASYVHLRARATAAAAAATSFALDAGIVVFVGSWPLYLLVKLRAGVGISDQRVLQCPAVLLGMDAFPHTGLERLEPRGSVPGALLEILV